MSNNNKLPNGLINEKSPYLQQHAYNPIHWYPWGNNAFEKAKSEDKPIFLSIGYSTCHWCHVMAHESFEDLEVAKLLNEYFICIKVDREERPDIDAVYMSVCQAMTGQGGWPLTVFMTPEQTPFYCATYIPKSSQYHSQGLMFLLPEIHKLWMSQRDTLLKQGDTIIHYLKQNEALSLSQEPCISLLTSATTQFKQEFDSTYGGFHTAPKFPSPHNLLFLIKYGYYEKDDYAIKMAEKTLEQMYRGGIFDHIGGGFSRYSTDEQWLVPHFEKMLYDNALLAYTYLEAYQITRKNIYKIAAKRTLDYVLIELQDAEGGFYCGQDADSDGIEGKYYIFTPEEIIDLLGSQSGTEWNEWYQITEKGNYEGKNIPNLLSNHEFELYPNAISEWNKQVYAYRLSRTTLHKDDKVLTSWNGLMITAFAKAYSVLGENQYYDAAIKAQNFISTKLTNENDRLMLRWRHDEVVGMGILDDYAFYCFGLLELYKCKFNPEFLQLAEKLATNMVTYFHDKESGGYFLYASDSELLISRPKELYDGAIPSGNAMAAQVFMALSALTGKVHWKETAYRQLQFLAGNSKHYPSGHTASLIAMMSILYPSYQLVCVAENDAISSEIQVPFHDTSFNNVDIIIKTPQNEKILSTICPFTKEYPIEPGKTAFYLCKDQTCARPVYSLDELKQLLIPEVEL